MHNVFESGFGPHEEVDSTLRFAPGAAPDSGTEFSDGPAVQTSTTHRSTPTAQPPDRLTFAVAPSDNGVATDSAVLCALRCVILKQMTPKVKLRCAYLFMKIRPDAPPSSLHHRIHSYTSCHLMYDLRCAQSQLDVLDATIPLHLPSMIASIRVLDRSIWHNHAPSRSMSVHSSTSLQSKACA